MQEDNFLQLLTALKIDDKQEERLALTILPLKLMQKVLYL